MKLSWVAQTSLAGAALLAMMGGAHPVSASDPGKAEELIRQANELRREGKDPAAVPLLRQAYQIARSPRTAAQLGLAELALGYWLEAERHLAEALAPASHPWVDRNRAVLGTSLVSARAHLATVIIEGQPIGGEVRINDTMVGTLPLPRPVRVSEGQLTIEVRSTRYRPETRTVELAGGATEHLSFSLLPLSESLSATLVTTSVPPKPHAGDIVTSKPDISFASPQLSTWRRTLPWALVAATAGVAGFAVWQHARWQSTLGDFDDIAACGTARDRRGSDSRCQPLYDSFTSHRTRAYVGYGAVAGLGVAAACAFAWNAGAQEQRARVVVTSPTGIELSFVGTF
jgi:hypothetical protein